MSVSGACCWKSGLMWAWLSPAFTAVLLLGVSGVPMVEAAGKKKWGDNKEYINYVNNTNCLIPGQAAPKLKLN